MLLFHYYRHRLVVGQKQKVPFHPPLLHLDAGLRMKARRISLRAVVARDAIGRGRYGAGHCHIGALKTIDAER